MPPHRLSGEYSRGKVPNVLAFSSPERYRIVNATNISSLKHPILLRAMFM